MAIISYDEAFTAILKAGLEGKAVLRYRNVRIDEWSCKPNTDEWGQPYVFDDILLVADSRKELEDHMHGNYPPDDDFWTRHYIEEF